MLINFARVKLYKPEEVLIQDIWDSQYPYFGKDSLYPEKGNHFPFYSPLHTTMLQPFSDEVLWRH